MEKFYENSLEIKLRNFPDRISLVNPRQNTEESSLTENFSYLDKIIRTNQRILIEILINQETMQQQVQDLKDDYDQRSKNMEEIFNQVKIIKEVFEKDKEDFHEKIENLTKRLGDLKISGKSSNPEFGTIRGYKTDLSWLYTPK